MKNAVIGALALSVFTLVGCEQAAIPVEKQSLSDFDTEVATTIKAYEDKASPFDKLPEIPLQFHCETAAATFKKICISEKVQVINNWAKAWAGDYQGQRNIAYVFSHYDLENIKKVQDDFVGGSILGETKIQACAWRIVAQKAGHLEYDSSDDTNLKNDCGKLDDAQLEASEKQAKTILEKISSKK